MYYQSVRYRKLNGICDAPSEWKNGCVSLSAAFYEFSLFNTSLIYHDSVKLNLSFKDLCHFMNISLFLLYFQSQLLTVTRKYRSPRFLNGLKKKHFCLCFSYISNVKVSVNNILFQVFGRCWSAFLYVDNIRQNYHVGNVDTIILFFA